MSCQGKNAWPNSEGQLGWEVDNVYVYVGPVRDGQCDGAVSSGGSGVWNQLPQV